MKNIIGLAGAVLLIIAAFLPWVTIGDQSISGFPESDFGGKPGALNIVIGAIAAIFCFLSQKWAGIITLVFGVLGFGWTFSQYSQASKGSEMAAALGVEGGVGMGIWLMFVASLIIVIGGFMAMRKK